MATMASEEIRETSVEVVHRLGTFGGHLWVTKHGRLRLELGDKMTYWVHPDLQFKYSSADRIGKEVERLDFDPSLIRSWSKDDRLTVRRVAEIVEKVECAVYGFETDGDMDSYYNIWDEGGISLSTEIRFAKFRGCNHSWDDYSKCTCEEDYEERNLREHSYWPGAENYAYVVHGGNEGYWLHVDCEYSIYDEHGKQKELIKKTVLSAKSFGDWEKLYESAARISYLLQWPI